MEKMKIEDLQALVVALASKVEVLEADLAKRTGPKTAKEMTDDDARRIMHGDLKDASHTKAAETLGLTYGQIYSARKGFTFKKIASEKQPEPKQPETEEQK